jgi:hypothetical protein
MKPYSDKKNYSETGDQDSSRRHHRNDVALFVVNIDGYQKERVTVLASTIDTCRTALPNT